MNTIKVIKIGRSGYLLAVNFAASVGNGTPQVSVDLKDPRGTIIDRYTITVDVPNGQAPQLKGIQTAGSTDDPYFGTGSSEPSD